MRIGLAPGMSFTLFCGRAVVLDQLRDRYFALSPRLSAALGDIGAGASCDPNAIDRLRNLGVLDDADRPIEAVRHQAAHASALEVRKEASPRDCSVASVSFAVLRARLESRPGRLAAVLHARQRRICAKGARADPVKAASMAGAFDAARAWLPLPRVCLTDSLALSAILIKAGVSHHLLFGVRLDPFYAHAWVEADGVVLSDCLDTIAGLNPILVA